ncbi:UNVERIFIED_CONTAM: hypothetical protein FKN15_006964 [Acipenser sinensis]
MASLHRPFLASALTLTRLRNGEMGPSLVALTRQPSRSSALRPVAFLSRGRARQVEGGSFGSGLGIAAARRSPEPLGASRGSRDGCRLQARRPPDPSSRWGLAARARSLSPRNPGAGTCRLRVEGLTTRWLPARRPLVDGEHGSPGREIHLPALFGRSSVDLPLRTPAHPGAAETHTQRLLLAVDHLARASMKNAAKLEN